MTGSRFTLYAFVAWCALGALVSAAPTPQVTSEIPCDPADRYNNSACPAGVVCRRVAGNCGWLAGCLDNPGQTSPTAWVAELLCDGSCSRSIGRCAADRQPCNSDPDCFGQETCEEGVCNQPGGQVRAPCNDDRDCATWLACIDGVCKQGDCAVDPDCPANASCERGSCVSGCAADSDCSSGVCVSGTCVPCRETADCGPRQVCASNECVAVQCTSNRDCPACHLCDVENNCVSLCRAGEECGVFPVLGPPPFFGALCFDRSAIQCQSRTQCPVGDFCLGGRCVKLQLALPPGVILPPPREQEPQCKRNLDCGKGQACISGHCIEVPLP
jgi:hypothetical protein